jgi:hypothetical protein
MNSNLSRELIVLAALIIAWLVILAVVTPEGWAW